MKNIIVLVSSFILLFGQEISPCNDVIYLELKKKKLDEISDIDYKYFLNIETQCNEFISAKKNVEFNIVNSNNNQTYNIIVPIEPIHLFPDKLAEMDSNHKFHLHPS